MICLSCRKKFDAGRYGKRRRVCSRPECRKWYRAHWAATRQPPRGVPDETFARILGQVTDPAHRAFLILARETGLRKGEVLGLTWGDVLDSAGKVRDRIDLRGQWDDARGFVETKGRRSRVAVLTSSARSAVESLIDWIRRRRDRLGREARVWNFSESGIYRWWIHVQARLGVKNKETGYPYRLHDLRHSVGVELVKAGKLDLAREILGHANIQTTVAIYGRRSSEEVLKEIEEVRREKKW